MQMHVKRLESQSNRIYIICFSYGVAALMHAGAAVIRAVLDQRGRLRPTG